jgi:hypothetical protein
MKKTIVAAAVAALVAAPAAFADVSVSGNVYLEVGDNNGEQDEVFSDLFFKSSEDLGNGLKVATTIQIVGDNDSATTANETRNFMAGDRILSVSGDFGTIEGGYMETYIEGSIMSQAATDASHTITIEGGVGNSTAGTGYRYVSPSVAGLSFVAETFDDAESTVAVKYSNAGLTVAYAQQSGTDAAAGDYILAQYSMGDLMVRAVMAEDDDGNEQNFYGATYTLGANTLGLGLIDANASSTNGQAGLAATDGDYTISLSHAMSKTTNAYVATFGNDDGDNETVVGVLHKF